MKLSKQNCMLNLEMVSVGRPTRNSYGFNKSKSTKFVSKRRRHTSNKVHNDQTAVSTRNKVSPNNICN
jgi:hypothetical protein